jgi:hypothetical protein
MENEELILSHIARVRLAPRERQTELKRLVTERDFFDEETIAAYPPFFWRAEISNDLLDSHFTRMSQSTLQNYAEDAERGVAFLKGHNWREIPIGYSLSGEYEVNGKQRVISDFYTVSGLVETDDLIARMKTGLLRDVSVGFHGGRAVCDICGSDFWECRHYPGIKYEEKQGDTVRTILSTFTIEDARLSEVSGVFDGSTPEAMILKAQRAAKSGELNQKQVEQLEQRYRVKLPVPPTVHSVTVPLGDYRITTSDNTFTIGNSERLNAIDFGTQELIVGGERLMEEKDFERILDVCETAGMFSKEDRSTVADEDVVGYIQKLAGRVKELEPQAEEGRQYRKDLIAEALAEGVRAYGNDFDKETYESTLNSSPLTVVKRMKADWKKTADTVLPAGRASLDDVAEEAPKKPVKNEYLPDGAFA